MDVYKEIKMAIGHGSGIYKKPAARIKDMVRKIWKKPKGGGSVTFGAAGTGHGSTTSNIGSDGLVKFKKKPRRNRTT